MSANELPPEDDPERPKERAEDDDHETGQWDMSEQVRRSADDKPILRDKANSDSETFGELSDEDDTDRFKISDSVDYFLAEVETPASVPARELESVRAAGPLEIWPTRREREAEIMGYPQDADREAVEQGRQNAEAHTTAQLTGMYERAGFLYNSNAGQRAAVVDPAEAADGARSWFTTTGRLSVHHHREFNYDDQSIRSRLYMNEDPSAFGVLEVQSQDLVPFNDEGDLVEVNVRVVYETVENGRVYWTRLQTGFTNPEDGAPCPEGEEALLGDIDPGDLPPGVTLNQAIEHRLLTYVWDNTSEVFGAVANETEDESDEISEVEAEAIDAEAAEVAAEIETEMEASGEDVPSVRDQALYEAGQQLLAYEGLESKDFGTYDAANAYVNLAKIAGRMGDASMAAGFCEMLETVDGVSNDKLAAAYFAGSDAGDPEMLTKVDTMLTGETIARMSQETQPSSLFGVAGLQQVIYEYETRGIAPDSLIEDKALSAEERWMLTAYHQGRTKGTDPEKAAAHLSTIRQVATNGIQTFSPEFVMGISSPMLYMCDDPATRAQILEQFTSAIDRLPASPSTYRALINVGEQVLEDQELSQAGYAQAIATNLDIQLEQLGDYSRVRDKRVWDVNVLAHAGMSAQEVRSGIRQSTEWSIAHTTDEATKQALAEDEGILLQTGAHAFAQQGKFADSRDLIADMGMDEQADAYEACLRLAKSPLDIARLQPKVDGEVMVYNPDITMLFAANQVRVGGDVDAMGAEVEKLAGIIATAGKDDKDSQLPGVNRCRSQAAELLSRMKALRPGSEIPAARALISGMQQSATYGSDLATMSYAFDDLMGSSNPADHAFVFKIIQDTNASAAKKAALYARLALQLTD